VKLIKIIKYRRLRIIFGLLVFLPALLMPASCSPSFVSDSHIPVTLDISAGASWTDAVREIDNLYLQTHPWVTIVPNFAGMGTLVQQVENGAPCDVFLSGAASYMDKLASGNLILLETRKTLLTNKVVLIVPSVNILGITGFNDLTSNSVKKIAIGDPKSVAVGGYAQQTFDLLGITAAIQSKFILGADTRQVLTYVETMNVDAGVVFLTDALTSSQVKVAASAPDQINSSVVYPVAVTKASKNVSDAKDYLAFLSTPQAKTVFEKFGFSMAKE
jgi:molybdate transport system substrate-binding protein